MQKIVNICDRCGRQYEDQSTTLVTLEKIDKMINPHLANLTVNYFTYGRAVLKDDNTRDKINTEQHFDLCPCCIDSLLTWLYSSNTHKVTKINDVDLKNS